MIILRKTGWLFFIVLAGRNNAKENKTAEISSPELQLSKIKLTSLEGRPINYDAYKGKILFINFWATWCKPCLEEMPSIQNAIKLLKDNNTGFLFASEETAEQIEKFKARNNLGFNFVRVENPEELNIMALPTTFIYNPEGKLVFSEMGYRKWDDKENIDLIINITKPK